MILCDRMPSTTVENYLKRVYQEQQKLAPRAGFVPVGRVAAAMGVAPGTGTSMVKALAKSGLVRYEPRKGVRLTAAGSQLALQVVRRHRLIELFLVEVLSLDWSEVHAEAEELEHAISDKVLAHIDDYLGHPTADPHGDPIPSANGKLPRQDLVRLTDCPTDIPLQVVRVLSQDADFLRYVGDHGLMPGTRVTVSPRQPVADAVTVQPAGQEQVTLGGAAAAKILVRPADAGGGSSR